MPLWQATEAGIRLRVRVQPRASRNRVVGLHGDCVRLQVTAPPVEGAANEAVVKVIAEWFGIPRRLVMIVQGESSREKLVEISGISAGEVTARLETLTADR